MLALTSIFLGIVPMVLFALLIWRIDCCETDPVPLIVGAFIWGAFTSSRRLLCMKCLCKVNLKPEAGNFNQVELFDL